MFTTTANCTDCSSKNFTSESTYRCTQCNTSLCVYHGQKHEKKNPTHTVERIGSATAPTFSSFTFSDASTTSNFGTQSTSNSLFGSPFGSQPATNNNISLFGSSSVFSSTTSNIPPFSFSFSNTTEEGEIDPFWQDKLLDEHVQRSLKRPPKRQFKIILVGDGAVGKSSMICTLLGKEFSQKYLATLGVEAHHLTFETTCGPVEFAFWDTAGQEKFGGLRDGYYLQGDGALVVYDVCSRMTYKSISNWRRDVTRVCEGIPIIMLGNKIDIKEQVSVNKKTAQCTACRYNLALFETSSKDRLSLLQPLEWMAKALVGDKTLRFTELLKQDKLGNEMFSKTTNHTQMSDLSVSTCSSDLEGL